MARRGLGLALVVLVAVPATAGAEPHQHSLAQMRTVEETVRADPGEVHEQRIDCPKGFIVLLPEWSRLSGEPTLRPVEGGLTFVVFEIDNRFSTALGMVTVHVLCVKLGLGLGAQFDGDSHSHDLAREIRKEEIELPGRGELTTTTVGCPKGSSAVDGFIRDDGQPGTDPGTRVTESMPDQTGGKWIFSVENLTSEQQTNATASVQCVGNETGKPQRGKRGKKKCRKQRNRRKKRCRKHRHPVKFKYVSEKVDVPASPQPQETGVEVEGAGKCPRGSVPTGAGWSFPGHPFTFLNTFTVTDGANGSLAGASGILPSRWFFTIFNQSTAQVAEVQVVCVVERTDLAG